MTAPAKILVGRIGAPHGVRGEVKLWSFTADPAAIVGYAPLRSARGEAVEIERLRPGNGFFVASLRGVADRAAAERLRNTDLYVARDALAEPDDPAEFYLADLIGLAAEDPAGEPVGTVVSVQNFGAGDLLEIQPASGPSILVPFTHAAVPVVDIAGQRVVVQRPDGAA